MFIARHLRRASHSLRSYRPRTALRLHCSPPYPHPPTLVSSLFPLSFHAQAGDPLSDADFAAPGSLESLPLPAEGADSIWYVPVRGVISLLDGFHDITGLPWWAVIATSTLVMRISLLPVLIVQFKKVGKFSQLFPKLPPPFPPPQSGITLREQLALHGRKRKELQCPSYMWNFAYVAVQFPCFLLWMTSIRRMCLDGHSGFENGGYLWFQDLTEFPHDICAPVFPLLVAGLHFINVQISFQTLKAAKLPGLLGLLAKYYKLYLDILSLPLFIIGFYIPQGSLVYWVTNSTLTLFQQLLTRNAVVRQVLGLPNINMRKENEAPSPGKMTSIHNHPSMKSFLNNESRLTEDAINMEEIESLSPGILLEQGLQQIASGNQDRALVLLK